MSKKVAFIIVGWNNEDLLRDCIGSIYKQTYNNFDIYYVDNDSKDNSVKLVKKNFPKVKLMKLGGNTGFARGNNLAIKESLKDLEVDHIVLLNTDARLGSDWTEKIINFAANKPHGALYQGTTLDYSNETVIDSTHTYISHNGQATQGNWRRFYQQEIGPKKVFGVNAAACLISRKFIEVQPFGGELLDERMFMYLEDVDLAARATFMGWDNYLVPGAVAYHMGSASSKNKGSNFSLYMTFRNNSSLLFKNFPLRLLIKILPRLIRGDIDTIRTLRRTNRKVQIRAVVTGRLIGIARLPLFMLKRHKVLRLNNVPDSYIWNLMRKGY